MCLNDHSNFLGKDELFLILTPHKESTFASAFVLHFFNLNHNVILNFKLLGTLSNLLSMFLIFSISLHNKKKDATSSSRFFTNGHSCFFFNFYNPERSRSSNRTLLYCQKLFIIKIGRKTN